MMERYFITGATGCIGGWVVKNLIESGQEVFALIRNPEKLSILELIMPKEEIAKIHVIKGDISDYHLLESALLEQQIDRVIHMAAMQLPFCQADPILGARVNVEGTVNMFEAVKKRGLKKLIYASSTAVYGTTEEYEEGAYDNNSSFHPHAHYGVYKQANEWSAGVYYEKDNISSIGLRPYVAYGPLRDQGATSTPTLAMKAAVKGEAYEISYGGEFDFQYVDDVAKAFIFAAGAEFEGAYGFNFAGNSVHMSEVVKAIEDACPQAKGMITYKKEPLPFPRNKSSDELEQLIGKQQVTTLAEGVKKSVKIFSRHLEMI
ncbi:MAG: NAD-dependent epimerase/dehydratase family protein [Lachnospiraceae bacterium]